MNNPKFGPTEHLGEITIAMDFNYKTCIDENRDKVKKNESIWSRDRIFQSKNFPTPSNQFIPGKTYILLSIPVNESSTSEECIKRCEQEPGFAGLFGAHGLALIDFDKLPKNKIYLSFDKTETETPNGTITHLWECCMDGPGVPGVRVSDEYFEWYIGYFNRVFRGGCFSLVCFCNKSLESEVG